MRYNVYVSFKSQMNPEFCYFPIMQDRRSKQFHCGSLVERWPTEYTKEQLGRVLTFAHLKLHNVYRVEVKQAENYDRCDDGGGGWHNGCPGDVAARDCF